jgi:ribosomal protein S12 methylthiotransferase
MHRLKVYLNPVGCPKANIDLERVGWLLEDQGFEVTEVPSHADIGVVFGCAFIDDAKREAIDDVLDVARLKKQGTLKHLVVVGCLPQKYGDELATEVPEIDVLVGNSCLGELPSVIDKVVKGEIEKRVMIDATFLEWGRGCLRLAPKSHPWTRTVLVCDGCDNACTYCSIPHMRGPLRSRPLNHIVEEIGFLASQGAREIILAGQDIASYGKDLEGASLSDLLATVADTFILQWIRLSYANPDNLGPGIGDIMAHHANVCNYIDMPIQHVSPKILSMMGRNSDPRKLRQLIAGLRQAVPDISMRTSVIVGFPGEDEEDFEVLMNFLREISFDLVGVFTYSPQAGTPAAEYPDQVPDDIKRARLVEVVSLQEQISKKKMEDFIGRELPVLVEDVDETGNALARSQYDMPEVDRIIRIENCTARPGTLIKARITTILTPYEWSAALL